MVTNTEDKKLLNTIFLQNKIETKKDFFNKKNKKKNILEIDTSHDNTVSPRETSRLIFVLTEKLLKIGLFCF